MKVKEGFVLREMGKQSVVVPVGSASRIFNGMIKLNDSSTYLWHHLMDGVTEEEMVQGLLGKYDVEEAKARADVKEFIEILNNAGIIEE